MQSNATKMVVVCVQKNVQKSSSVAPKLLKFRKSANWNFCLSVAYISDQY